MPVFNRPQYLTTGDNALLRAAMQGIGGAQPAHIEITGGKFTLINAGKEVLKTIAGDLDVVVLDANQNMSKAYYDKRTPYDPSNPQPPLCWSDNGVAPSANAREPQNPTCGLCPHNKWGSAQGLGGSKVKSCKDYKKIAVWVPAEKSTQFLLRIPPNSFSYWNAYCGFIGAQNAELWQVITRISFSKDPKEPMTLYFDVAQSQNGEVMWVPPKFEAWYRGRLADHAWDDLIGRNDQPIEGALAQLASPASGAERNRTLPPARPAPAAESPVQAANEPEAQAPTPPPPARRGRPPKARDEASQQTVQGNGQAPFDAGPEMPDFLKRTSPGMVGDAPAPDAGIAAAMDDAFET